MSTETKSFTISGAAAESYLSGRKTRRKRNQKGGQQVEETQPQISESDRMLQLDSRNTTNATPRNVIVKKETPQIEVPKGEIPRVEVPRGEVPKVETPNIAPTTTSPANVTQILGGGDKKKLPVKVILEKTKKTKEKIVLAHAKPKTLKEPPGVIVAKKAKTKTLKAARRIRVSLDGLSKRIHRAKTIKKDSEKISLEDIKKKLQQAGLIKKDSKAPETMLRQMYIDLEQLKQRAL